QPLDVSRSTRLSARRLAAVRLLLDGPLRACGLGLSRRGGRGARLVLPRLQPGPRGPQHPPPPGPSRPRRAPSSRVLLSAAANSPAPPQGPADLPPRSGSVVPVPHILRSSCILFSEHSPAGLRSPESLLAQLGQFP